VYSNAELLDKVQASEQEIKAFLRRINAFEYRSCWRVLDEEFRVEVLKNVLYKLMEKDWDVIVVRLVSQEFPEIPYEVLQALLRTVGTIEKDVVTVDRLKLYQMCAIDLFLTNTEYLYDEFVTAYGKLVDLVIYHKFVTKAFGVDDVVEGIAVKRIHNYRTTLKYLPKDKLPFNLEERLSILFSVKEKWTEKELAVYLTDVSLLSMPQLLLRYTKRVLEGTSVFYTGKLN
jgi:sister chromatid cohesion protein DCC1